MMVVVVVVVVVVMCKWDHKIGLFFPLDNDVQMCIYYVPSKGLAHHAKSKK